MEAATIASVRRELRLTQARLAELTGVHPMTVSKWERGVLRPGRHALAILDALRAAAGQARASDARGARELAGFLNQAYFDASELEGMKLSASNQLRGTIVALDEGPVSTRVVIEVAPEVRIASLITTASSRRLELAEGAEVVAVIKATEVIVGVPD